MAKSIALSGKIPVVRTAGRWGTSKTVIPEDVSSEISSDAQ